MDWILTVLLIVNIPLFNKVFGFIFKSKEDFYESLGYLFTPDIYSLFKGRYGKDYLGELKIFAFLIICGFAIYLQYSVIEYATDLINGLK